MLYRLYWLGGRKDEQLSIGVGAKMGNGLLVTLLGLLSYRTRALIGSRNSSSAWR